MPNIKNSIRTKFIVLFSVLMAVILALQFYFMNQTQQDMLAELSNLSESINSTTNKILIKEFQKQKMDSIRVVLESTRLPKLKKKQRELIKRLTKIKTFKNDTDFTRIIKWNSKSDTDDSVEEVEIHLPQFSAGKDSVFTKYSFDFDDNRESKILSINVPDFSVPDAPRLFKYKYSTSSVKETLKAIYRKNLFITLLIFALSLVLIIYITRRFLKPIEQLKNSFEDVVNGDLNVTVQNGGTDEIGSLTRSFNTMVGELQKNRQKEKLLQRKERLASLGQLAAGVAHEIKNPLNAIHLTITHLNDKYIPQDSAAAVKYIQTVQMEIQRLDKIVNNFLNYLRSEDLKKKQLDVNRLLEQVLLLYEREITASEIHLQKEFAKGFKIDADEERMKTALVNILVNALQAMPNGGTLTVQTDRKKQEIRISDSGNGIPQKELEHVFDLFYTTKQNGSGLGLPTAYKIIREHNADLQIKSAEGQGTTIIIRWAAK